MADAGRFAGKVALITGAASGIGRATALAFAREGASIAISDIDVAGLEETARLAAPANIWTLRIDVTARREVDEFVQGAVDHFGRIDCAANCAGIRSTVKPLGAFSEDEFDRVIAVNMKGVWLSMRAEIEAMMLTGGGAIVNVASGAGVIAVPDGASYVASKHAVVGLTKAGGVDYAAHGIRINAICPGYTRTPMALGALEEYGGDMAMVLNSTPIGRIAEPEEQAAAILYLCSEAASFIIGHPLVVDGGHSIW